MYGFPPHSHPCVVCQLSPPRTGVCARAAPHPLPVRRAYLFSVRAKLTTGERRTPLLSSPFDRVRVRYDPALNRQPQVPGFPPRLRLPGGRLGDEGAQSLAEALLDNGSLTALHLQANRCTAQCCPALAAALAQCDPPTPHPTRRGCEPPRWRRFSASTLS